MPSGPRAAHGARRCPTGDRSRHLGHHGGRRRRTAPAAGERRGGSHDGTHPPGRGRAGSGPRPAGTRRGGRAARRRSCPRRAPRRPGPQRRGAHGASTPWSGTTGWKPRRAPVGRSPAGCTACVHGRCAACGWTARTSGCPTPTSGRSSGARPCHRPRRQHERRSTSRRGGSRTAPVAISRSRGPRPWRTPHHRPAPRSGTRSTRPSWGRRSMPGRRSGGGSWESPS